MASYTFKHFNAAATRDHMEDVVKKFGGIEVKSYEIAKLHVETDDAIADKFQQTHPHWIVTRAPAV